MRPLRLDRRTLLRGAGSVAIALPWLEAMDTPRQAHAQSTGDARRFITVYTPGGTVLDRFWPTGTETDFTLSPILAPLEPMVDRLLVLQGIDMQSAIPTIHEAGMVGWLTGSEQVEGGRYPGAPSIDQVLAQRISAGNPKPSVQLAVRWATGKSHGRLSPMNTVNFEAEAPHSPIPPSLDPQAIFTDWFGTLDPSTANDAAARISRKQSILDYVGGRYNNLAQRLGAADRQKLEQHLTKIRELENALENGISNTSICEIPAHVDTSGYNPTTALNSSDDGSILDASTDEAIPAVGRFMIDMLVMALACDLTSVASFQWTDTEAKHTFPWLGLSQHHHFYQHDGGFRPNECAQICTWYSEQHLYLLQALADVSMGDHSLLDESVVFFGSELSDPPTHRKDTMPFLLAGGGGGLRGGRHLRFDGVSHNNLLVSILNLFGDERQTFGDEWHCTGPLGNLT